LASEPRWLEPDDLIALNEAIVSETEEPFVLRDEGLLESALHSPHHLYLYEGETDVVRLAARLAMAISQNHPFAQGNKRTAFSAALIFLEVNGYELDMPDDVGIAEAMIDEVAGESVTVGFEQFLRRSVKPSECET
jgi:death-on-curing protein